MASFAENLVKNLNYPLSLGLSDRLSHLSTSLAQSLNLKPQQPQVPPTEPVDIRRLAPPAPEQTKGTFEINLIDAKHLAIHDSLKAQVYCLVYYQGNVLSTLDTIQNPVTTTANATNASYSPFDLLNMVSRQANPTWNTTATFDVSSEQGELTLFVYDRGNPLESGEDRCLGTATLQPRLQHEKTIELRLELQPPIPLATCSQSTTSVSGHVRLQLTYMDAEARIKLTPDSFHIVRLLGRGSFGKVYQVIKRNTKQTYAMKVLSKRLLVAENEIAHTLSERNVLIGTFTNPFIVSLKFSFQTPEHLFLVMEYIPGGDLFEHLQRQTFVSDQVARFFISEIICAFQDIHAQNVVYRDLKPENIMLDSLGHIALTDFGLCKELGQSQTTATFCGTGEYLAPEMVLHKPYGQQVDWWSLGILLYELLVGRPPFQAVNRNTLYDRICRAKLSFPSHVSAQSKDLIRSLLERDPLKRLGAKGAEQVKAHPWFDAVQWDLVASKRVQPPPLLASKPPPKPICIPTSKKRDTHASFLSSLQDNSPLSPTIQSAFHGFSYVNETSQASLRSSIISFDDDDF